MAAKLTREQFIERAMLMNGNKYDYSKSVYIIGKIKLEIICPEHGSFWQTPNCHTHIRRPRGCPKCANNYINTEKFINKSKKLHGDIYNYERVLYTAAKTKVEIICHRHGSFWQTPNSHTMGQGCPKCQFHNMTVEERFWSRVNKYGKLVPNMDTRCWSWLGRKNDSGYGQFNIGDKGITISRYSYILHYGLIPSGMLVCHKCDNPECTNPDHLFLGSTKDNTRDSINKGRFAWGEKSGMAKLTCDNVIEIRILWKSGLHDLKQLSDRFNVHKVTISSVVNNKSWRSVNA